MPTELDSSRSAVPRLGPVGMTWDAGACTWTSDDTLLYALGIGAGREDLAFTTENSQGVVQQVFPTFPSVLQGKSPMPSLGTFPLSALLHAEQSVRLPKPIPAEGSGSLRGRIAGVYDKGRDAQITIEQELVDDGGEVMATIGSSVFVRGHGGFGGERGQSAPWELPDRAADAVVSVTVPPNQALIYRLSGDRNPLHSDPSVASMAGFEQPILHGLCTFGYAGRALLQTVCDGEVDRFAAISARFTATVLPGQTLETHIWSSESGALFRTAVGTTVVLDRGVLETRSDS